MGFFSRRWFRGTQPQSSCMPQPCRGALPIALSCLFRRCIYAHLAVARCLGPRPRSPLSPGQSAGLCAHRSAYQGLISAVLCLLPSRFNTFTSHAWTPHAAVMLSGQPGFYPCPCSCCAYLSTLRKGFQIWLQAIISYFHHAHEMQRIKTPCFAWFCMLKSSLVTLFQMR